MTTSPPPPGTFPIGLNRALAVAFIVLGVINLLLYAIDSSHPVINLLLGLVLGFTGVVYLRGQALLVTPTEVQRKSPLGMVGKRFPIASLADLRFDDKRLMHVPTGERIAVLGWNADKADVARLRDAVELAGVRSAGTPSPPPPPGA